jgi:hypothetical protein
MLTIDPWKTKNGGQLILWEAQRASGAEVTRKEIKLILPASPGLFRVRSLAWFRRGWPDR